MYDTVIRPDFIEPRAIQHFSADAFPNLHPVRWLHAHFAVGAWSPLRRLSGLLCAQTMRIAPGHGFKWHPHRGLEIYTWVLEGRLQHEDTAGNKGEIGPGESQRLFAGEWIQHQEMNRSDEHARVVQIWYAADIKFRGLEPHYQQLRQGKLSVQKSGQVTTYNLIGNGSPMEQHMTGRLTATTIEPGGSTELEPPMPGDDLLLYVTDGLGQAETDHNPTSLGQYDVMLARPDAASSTLSAAPDQALHYLCFYLPTFLP
jgi:redox-sensitive bicupin YhaK (pirin superfamily)